MQDAEAEVPYAVFGYLPRLDPEWTLRRLVEPNELIKQASRERGEVGARTLVRALRETAELLYEPYLRFLWYLADVRQHRLSTPPSFGNLVTQLGQRLNTYPDLVDADAGWLRNAAAHGHWEYLPKQPLLRMWDRNHPARLISVHELRDVVRRLLKTGGQVMTVAIERYRLESTFGAMGCFATLLDRLQDLAGDDPTRRQSAISELDADLRVRFAPINSLFAKYGWTKRPMVIASPDLPTSDINQPDSGTETIGA